MTRLEVENSQSCARFFEVGQSVLETWPTRLVLSMRRRSSTFGRTSRASSRTLAHTTY
jgi:hypothetical protein